VVAFLLFQAVSALTGYAAGGLLGRGLVASFAQLGLFGYLAAGVGATVLAVGSLADLGTAVLMLGVAVLGLALGVIETLEPFGALSAARSLGVFTGNLMMGLLYSLGPQWSYAYAAAVAVAAAAVILGVIPRLRRSPAANETS
jgi:hypothetical protein